MPETIWTRVRRAGIDSVEGRAALSEVLADYWTPVYHYLRRRGYPAPEAEDHLQAFFEALLDRRLLQRANPDKGSFRHLLLHALRQHIQTTERVKAAEKRGGRAHHIAFDFAGAEERYASTFRDDTTPEDVLQQEWLAILQHRVSEKLAAEYRERNQEDRYRALLPYVFEKPDKGLYVRLGEELGMSRNHVAVFVSRLKDDWRDTALIEAARTSGTIGDARRELGDLGVGGWVREDR